RDLAGGQLTLVVERISVGAVRLRACLIEEGFGLSHRHVVDCRDQSRRVAGRARHQTLEAVGHRNLVRSRRGADASRIRRPANRQTINLIGAGDRHDTRRPTLLKLRNGEMVAPGVVAKAPLMPPGAFTTLWFVPAT